MKFIVEIKKSDIDKLRKEMIDEVENGNMDMDDESDETIVKQCFYFESEVGSVDIRDNVKVEKIEEK